MTILENLNPDQEKICRTINGPVLILAGAGSGKTRVLTHRIAHLILDHQVNARSILAVTFTNKAAKEMKLRVEALLNQRVDSLWIGTFHSIFARLLRIEASRIGYDSNFTIYDTNDSVNVVKKILTDLNISIKDNPPKGFYFKISSWKDKLILPSKIEYHASMLKEELEQYIYDRYEAELKKNNAFDFNDLIIKPIELFKENLDVLEKYQNYFQYILVDEYQDTNHAQYQLIKLLSSKHHNITVVGDEDQSIYKWRGADISNILNFEKDFEQAQSFRLEQNYRSTSLILDAANHVVKHNDERLGKTLWTKNYEGDKISLIEADSDRDESELVFKNLLKEIKKRDLSFSDCVILYRTNAQSRVLEESCRKKGIAYSLVGGQKFYERKEIKDLIAYLKAIVNPADSLAIRRIINYPARGIGDKSLERVQSYANQNGLSLFDALAQIAQISTLNNASKKKIHQFKALLDDFIRLNSELNAYDLTKHVLEETGIKMQFTLEGTIESMSRKENLDELLKSISEFVEEREENSLQKFLEEVQLLSDVDQWNDEQEKVTLMTLHSAKGLEFPLVFIVGLEEGLFPHENSIFEGNLEEERRLFYVGITRAEQKLYFSWAKRRMHAYQSFRANMKSSFLKEIPSELLDVQENRELFKQRKKTWSNSDIEYDDFDQSPQQYRFGMLVEHDVFGKGRISSISGFGEMAKISVRFESGMTKKLIAKYANLKTDEF